MLYGHKDKIDLFERLIDLEKLSHSYLFFGDSGIGKFLFAKSIARRIETFNWNEDRILIDSKEFCPEEDKIFIGINIVREIKTFLWQTPFSSKRRIAIINDAHLLTPESQGAMLKIVEEPPKHALIILISHDPSVFSAPLLSRLTKVYFPRFSEKEISVFLKNKGIKEKEIEPIARRSYGSIGRALELVGKKPGLGDNFLEKTILDLREKDVIGNSRKLDFLLKKEMNIKQFRLNYRLQEKAIKEFLWKQ